METSMIFILLGGSLVVIGLVYSYMDSQRTNSQGVEKRTRTPSDTEGAYRRGSDTQNRVLQNSEVFDTSLPPLNQYEETTRRAPSGIPNHTAAEVDQQSPLVFSPAPQIPSAITVNLDESDSVSTKSKNARTPLGSTMNEQTASQQPESMKPSHFMRSDVTVSSLPEVKVGYTLEDRLAKLVEYRNNNLISQNDYEMLRARLLQTDS
jgi:hypothetical protein